VISWIILVGAETDTVPKLVYGGLPALFWAPAGATETSISPYTQCIRNPIDIVKPGRNQRDLQDGLIVKTGASQLLMILLRKAGGIPGKLGDVVEHKPILLSNGSSPVVLLQGFH
jgi:hypothetical protein